MLQQTQVNTAIPYFRKWIKRFPDFAALAKARESTVLKHWEGLGYYSRARNLHKLARVIVKSDSVPKSAEDWASYPGIGPYTSRAIASIRFGQPTACVDGNVIRVIARLTGYSEEFKDTASASRILQRHATMLLDNKSPGTHNEAMMELGATVCSRKEPKCQECPVESFCSAKKAGMLDQIPRFKTVQYTRSRANRAFSENGGSILLQRNSNVGRRLSGQWELPTMTAVGALTQKTDLIGKRSRTIGKDRIEESIYKVRPTRELMQRVRDQRDLKWATNAELARLTLSGPHRRWVEEIQAGNS